MKFTSQRPVSERIEEQTAQITEEITDKITKLVKASPQDGAKHRDPAPKSMELAEVPQSAPCLMSKSRSASPLNPTLSLQKKKTSLMCPRRRRSPTCCEECSESVSWTVSLTTGLYRTVGRVKRVVNVLYHVKYTDGDVEHLVADQVRKWSRAFEEAASATQEQSAHQVRAAETGKRRARAHRQRALPRRQLIGRWLSQQ